MANKRDEWSQEDSLRIACILEIIDWNEISSGIKHLIWLASLMFVQQCNKFADQNKAMTSDEWWVGGGWFQECVWALKSKSF